MRQLTVAMYEFAVTLWLYAQHNITRYIDYFDTDVSNPDVQPDVRLMKQASPNDRR